MSLILALIIGLMFATGVYQILRRNVIRSAIGLVIISNAVNLFLLAAGAYDGLRAPYARTHVNDQYVHYSPSDGPRSDPLPQALVLTAIVISMGGFSFVLALLYIVIMRRNTADLAQISDLKH